MIMNDNKLKLSMRRMIVLLVLYFGGYLYIFPLITSRLTLVMDSQATHIAYPLVIATYIISITLALYLTFPVWKASFRHFKADWKKHVAMIVSLTLTIFALNLVLSFLVSMITGSSTSNNQESIDSMSQMVPLLTFVASVIFAPLLEESVFRGGVFTVCRARYSFLIAAFISSLLFGSIHIIDSLLSGNFIDTSYLVVYAGMGFVMAYGYEKSNSLLVPLGIHFLNNLIVMLMML